MKIKWYHITIAVMAICILLLSMCGSNRGCPDIKVNTIDSNTVVTVTPHDVKGTDTSKPVLVKTEKPTKPIITPTLPPVIIKIPDTAGIATLKKIIDSLFNVNNEYYALYTTQNEYWDGLDLVDSTTGKSYGFVYLIDTVAGNSIVGRSKRYELHFSDTTRTTTITKTVEKKRFQMYLGGEIGGYKQEIFSLAGLGVLFKTKKDNLYGLKATLDLNGQLYYSVQYYKLISFRKKK